MIPLANLYIMFFAERLHVQLVPNSDTTKLGFPTGIYSMKISPVSIKLALVTRCDSGNRNSTPVEAFDAVAVTEKTKLPLTMIGNVQLKKTEDGPRLTLEMLL